MHRWSVLEFRISRYPAEHPAAGRLATVVNADGKQQHVAYTTSGEQRGVWGASIQPLLYDYNEYGERVGMRTFQTTPDGHGGPCAACNAPPALARRSVTREGAVF